MFVAALHAKQAQTLTKKQIGELRSKLVNCVANSPSMASFVWRLWLHSWALLCATSIKIIKNEVGCRDDTVPKTVDTRRHCEEE